MFFIYDCMGNVVGNPKGYRTIKGALRVQDYHAPTRLAILQAFERRPNKANMLLCEVR